MAKKKRARKPRANERWLYVECLRPLKLNVAQEKLPELINEVKRVREMLEAFAREKKRRVARRSLVDGRVRISFSTRRVPRTGIRYRTYRPQGPRGPAVRIAFTVKKVE